jgi:pyrophosphatase PpaX
VAARAFLFDLDGTIWDSYPWYASGIGLGAGVDPQLIVADLEQGASVVSLARRYRVAENQLFFSDRKLELFPGVQETLDELMQRGIRLGAVTNLPGRLVIRMLAEARLESYFSTVIHAGNCRPLKPHPKPILTALTRLGVPADELAIYVGDRSVDAKAAQRAGISFAWVSYGYGTKPLGAKYVVNRLNEVLLLGL